MSVRQILLEELSDALGGDVSEDVINYILQMDKPSDMTDYFEGILGDRQEAERIVNRICQTRGIATRAPVATVQQEQTKKVADRRNRNQAPARSSNNRESKSTTSTIQTDTHTLDRTTTRNINKKSTETSEDHTSNIVSCGCQATLHDLLYNCTYCGYILCKREENKEQDKQQCPFCKRYINRNYVLDTEEYQAAEENKNKLLYYDRNNVARRKVYDGNFTVSTVFDDQSDYYTKDDYSDVWVTDKEREELIKKEKERQKKREETHGPNKNMYLDFSKLI